MDFLTSIYVSQVYINITSTHEIIINNNNLKYNLNWLHAEVIINMQS